MYDEKIIKRLTDVESTLTYLQSDYESLNETVLENTRRLEQLRLAIERLTEQVQTAGQPSDGPANLEDEKPPHY